MSELVDRVAFAIEQAEIDFNGLAVTDPSFSRKPHPEKIAMARAAIEAMREPTKEIIKAHHVVPDDTNFDERAADNWRNLIDAILVTEPA